MGLHRVSLVSPRLTPPLPLRQDIESYRIPSIFEFARVRLHTGNSAPNTYFVGRRVKDSAAGDFALDFIKVVNLTSAACSAAFQLGAAETKVAMDGLTASEAVSYMRALSGHVLRSRKQVLSCAWNLNSPLVDDLAAPDDAEGNFKVIKENLEIGKRGIELAVMGGFDKVGRCVQVTSGSLLTVTLGTRSPLTELPIPTRLTAWYAPVYADHDQVCSR